MNQGPICAKVYPEGIQPIKENNCGLIPEHTKGGAKSYLYLPPFDSHIFVAHTAGTTEVLDARYARLKSVE